MNASTAATLDIQLLGKEYKVACPPDERAALQEAAALLNARLEEAAAKGRFSGERLIAMVALNLAHELLSKPADSHDASTAATAALDSDEFARRIESIETRIDAVLAG
ncbi:MAG TPA: cell division protein ZapA [Rhodocyclaceae bacterium]|nr:cell division protein ZapA [Rhodocyclaceae bacterium]